MRVPSEWTGRPRSGETCRMSSRLGYCSRWGPHGPHAPPPPFGRSWLPIPPARRAVGGPAGIAEPPRRYRSRRPRPPAAPLTGRGGSADSPAGAARRRGRRGVGAAGRHARRTMGQDYVAMSPPWLWLLASWEARQGGVTRLEAIASALRAKRDSSGRAGTRCWMRPLRLASHWSGGIPTRRCSGSKRFVPMPRRASWSGSRGSRGDRGPGPRRAIARPAAVCRGLPGRCAVRLTAAAGEFALLATQSDH